MIPTILLLGLVAGLVLPDRWGWWSVPALGVAWVVLLVATNGLADGVLPIIGGGFLYGAGNALVAVVVGKVIRAGAVWLSERLRAAA